MRIVSPVMKSLSSRPARPWRSRSRRPSAERRRVLDRFRLGVCRRRRRQDRSWRDRVHENIVRRELERQRLGQGDDAGLRHVVRKVAACSAAGRFCAIQSLKLMIRPPPCVRMCGAAACAQRNAARRSTLSAASQSAAVSSSNGRFSVDGRHVDQNVEAPEFVRRALHERVGRGRLRQVGLEDRRRGGPSDATVGGGLIGLVLRARVGDGDVNAAGRQLARRPRGRSACRR